MEPLDHPALAALTGPQAHLAEQRGRVRRYLPDVAPFAALPLDPGPADWADLRALVGDGGTTALLGGPAAVVDTDPPRVPGDWEVLAVLTLLQMTYDGPPPAADPAFALLGPDDHAEMLDLTARTKPGPFTAGTPRTGRYLGLRRDGALVAMAGERMGLDGWSEISAVCTDPVVRGQGLAGRAVLAVAETVLDQGRRPFLHVVTDNVAARRVYERIGFTVRRDGVALVLRPR